MPADARKGTHGCLLVVGGREARHGEGGMIADDVELAGDVLIYHPDQVNLYGCRIGSGSKIGSFVEIRRDVVIGRNVKIQAFVFIPEGVSIGDGVFLGPHACFTNDIYPRAVAADGGLLSDADWERKRTTVEDRASIVTRVVQLTALLVVRFSALVRGLLGRHS